MKGVLLAAGIGAVAAAFLYCCMNAGLRAGTAVADYRARRREAHERTQA